MKEILVEREQFESKGKIYNSYFIKGIVRNQEIKLSVVPPDNGGYKVLDIVFNGGMKAELGLKPYRMTDEKTKTVIEGNTYFVRSTDDDGTVYECKVGPARTSDKNLLEMLIRS